MNAMYQHLLAEEELKKNKKKSWGWGSCEKRCNHLVESNEQLQKAAKHLLCKEFSEVIDETRWVWKVMRMNEGRLLRSTRVRTIQIMIESMIKIRDLDQMLKCLQHLRTIDANNFDTEWLELYYLVGWMLKMRN
jgi:hypothetical protein